MSLLSTPVPGVGIVAISFAMAVGQFVWGAVQPIFGVFADRYGTERVLISGAILLAAGLALTTFASSEWALIATLGVISAAGAGAGSFSILIGATAQRIAPEKRAFSSGFINAGGSLGQFVFSTPLPGAHQRVRLGGRDVCDGCGSNCHDPAGSVGGRRSRTRREIALPRAELMSSR